MGWHLGRITTYVTLGATSGALGSGLRYASGLAPAISMVLVVLFSASLAGLLPEPGFAMPRARAFATWALRRRGALARYLFGIANGLLPCGMVYAALGLAVATGAALGGGLVMLAFGLGTVPLLGAAGTGMKRLLGRSVLLRRCAAIVALVSGLLAVMTRAG